MTCHGGFNLDEDTRRSWFNPEAILRSTGLEKGMVFIDVGSGDGFFTMLAGQIVGETGKVFAVDIDPSAIERLRQKAVAKSFKNVKATVGEAENTIFCEGCADVVFCSIVLHDFHDPLMVLKNAKRMLKPSGKLVDLDWKKSIMSFGPPERIRFSEEKASSLIESVGLRILSVNEAGPYHYVIAAEP